MIWIWQQARSELSVKQETSRWGLLNINNSMSSSMTEGLVKYHHIKDKVHLWPKKEFTLNTSHSSVVVKIPQNWSSFYRKDAAFSPGAQLVFTTPHEVSKLLIVGIVVMLDSIKHRRRNFHQHIVGHLLLLSTGVAIVQVVHPVCYFCQEEKVERREVQRDKNNSLECSYFLLSCVTGMP